MANEMKDATAMKRRTFLTGTAASMAAMAITIPAGRALAAGYPERPITVVVMYSAGGKTI
jgi:tripartite-type tricarboxylate transporter receptor subunit TctC